MYFYDYGATPKPVVMSGFSLFEIQIPSQWIFHIVECLLKNRDE